MECRGRVCVEVITRQDDGFSSWVVRIQEFLDLLGPVHCGLAWSDTDLAPARMRCGEHEIHGGCVSLTLVVVAFWLARTYWDHITRLPDQLHLVFVHIDNGRQGAVVPLIDVPDVLQRGVLLGRNHPEVNRYYSTEVDFT